MNELLGLDTQLPVDTFRVRWALNVEGLAEIKDPGQTVKITELVEKKNVKIGNKQVTVQGLVQTLTGLIPISYLEPKAGQACSSLEKKIIESNPVIEAVAQGQWWLGRVSPVEVGVRLSRDPSLLMGNYAVCQPPEMDPLTTNKWAEFVLVVRNISGDVDQWMYEWEVNNRFNQKFSKTLKGREIGNDIIVGPPESALPAVVYFIIKRTR
ncbi:hypothetical protein DICVIV_00459 [Dictyocaulus viviparus]|uniref:Uncharacterized protein n=1 Tax=Dictyocaulus viviparus TaxID=29172 RepID=A0A0D8YFB4_DICVI|nr:hypothetical protein DICVIV_00459 [Dictyocaulus viviparus]